MKSLNTSKLPKGVGYDGLLCDMLNCSSTLWVEWPRQVPIDAHCLDCFHAVSLLDSQLMAEEPAVVLDASP